ncbi:hypothetical protein CsSME_00018243 [Camellia sinensis var. sinensis]
MEIKSLLLTLVALISFCYLVHSFEPSPLQDFCVADTDSSVRVNGFVCRNPMMAQASDFSLTGLNLPGDTSNPLGSAITPATVAQIPGLNTLGISMVRIDYAPWGLNPPHIHPRATEIFTVLEGTLEVGFVTSNLENRFISKVLKKGDVFVFPIGLIHYERNVGYGSAIAIAGLSSQNPGVITVANAVFRSKPMISGDVLAKTFQVNMTVVDAIQGGM